MSKMKKVFYATVGADHPFSPGYFIVTGSGETDDECNADARYLVNSFTDSKWCGMYEDVDDIKEEEKIYRGKIENIEGCGHSVDATTHIAERMQDEGGSLVHSLGVVLEKATAKDVKKIRELFPEYWDTYSK